MCADTANKSTRDGQVDNTIWNKEKTHPPPVPVTRPAQDRDAALNFEPRTYFMINSKTKSAECVPVSDWYCLNLIYFAARDADFAPNEYAFPNGRAVLKRDSNARSIFEFESIERIAWEHRYFPFRQKWLHIGTYLDVPISLTILHFDVNYGKGDFRLHGTV